jgi:hypothetical protein
MPKINQQGGFIFSNNKNKTSIKNLCSHSNLEEIHNNTRLSDAYLLELCPELTKPSGKISILSGLTSMPRKFLDSIKNIVVPKVADTDPKHVAQTGGGCSKSRSKNKNKNKNKNKSKNKNKNKTKTCRQKKTMNNRL